jgi:hypothetical protein
MSSASNSALAAAPSQAAAPAAGHAPAGPGRCLNCDATVAGKFCAECGQSRDDHSRSVLGFVHEFVEHHLLLDSKMLRTGYALVLKPGRLTRAYLEGRRARYVSPFKLYLFMSLVFFVALFYSGLAVFQVTGRIDVPSFVPDSAVTDGGKSLSDAIEQAHKASAWAESASPAERDAAVGKAWFFAPVQEGGLQIGDRIRTEIEHGGSAGESALSKHTGQGLLMALEHPRLLNTVLDEWLPRLLVLLLPFVALWLALFAWGRGLYYVDNLAFALHGQAFAFLLGTLAIAARKWLPSLPIMLPLGAVMLVWTVLAYRHVYRSGWIGTVLKVGFVGTVYAAALSIGLGVAMVLGLSEIPG